MMLELVTHANPLLLLSTFGSLVMFGLMFYFMQDSNEKHARTSVRKRLDHKPVAREAEAETATPEKPKNTARKLAKRTNDFYATNDPKALRKIQMQLIQAGYLQENALGYFIASRFALGIAFAITGVILAVFFFTDMPGVNKAVLILLSATIGYFLPNFHLGSRTKKLQAENRGGFPDVMDLMIVAAEAGLTLEASIERIAKEIERTYPTLSRQLTLAALEIRAGRQLDQALRAFGERLGIDEVQGFATMIQQSKELGTSVSDALRVYSDEMRHKRMMAAEEKAYALPAKLSIPVTAFILPVVIGIAVLPTAVRMMNQ
jgi:tight adherence protein C